MSINLGETIFITHDLFDESKKITIEWSQDYGSKRKGTYFTGRFTTCEEPAKKEGLIFVQEEYKEKFESLATEKTATGFKVVVDKSFQFGQLSKDGKGRWLAYHDKTRKMYQHRFQETLATKTAAWLEKITSGSTNLYVQIVSAVPGLVKSGLGDYLRDF